jgi:hypothetical protein
MKNGEDSCSTAEGTQPNTLKSGNGSMKEMKKSNKKRYGGIYVRRKPIGIKKNVENVD